MNVTWPFARLTADGQHLTVRMNALLMDDVIVTRDEVVRVHDVRGLWSRGLRFEVRDRRLDRTTFWTPPFRHAAVVSALRVRGWPVD
jgi:hypothetical protein